MGSKDGDLTNLGATRLIFETHKPTYVIHLAAKVGGLFANMDDKASFYEDNLAINTNVIKMCKEFNVKRLVCALSTCIFPAECDYPVDVDALQ